MAHLKFYRDEQIMLDKLGFIARDVRILDEKDIRKISKKICKHFKIELVDIVYRNCNDGGSARLRRRVIRLDHKPSYRTLIHELAHFYIYDNNMVNEKHHTKKLMRTIRKFAKYVMKMNYWMDEVANSVSIISKP